MTAYNHPCSTQACVSSLYPQPQYNSQPFFPESHTFLVAFSTSSPIHSVTTILHTSAFTVSYISCVYPAITLFANPTRLFGKSSIEYNEFNTFVPNIISPFDVHSLFCGEHPS